MKTTLVATLFTALSSLAAFAHPGPPGHVHEDDWPFDPLMVIVVVTALAAGILARSFLRPRQEAEVPAS